MTRIQGACVMRSRLADVTVFICVFCLFLGYCEWWKSRPETIECMNASSPPDHSAYRVAGAADESFDGVYLPTESHARLPCFMKESPRRFLWQSDSRWHLSIEPAQLGAGYMTEVGCKLSSDWVADGAPEPVPMVIPVSEAAGSLAVSPKTTGAEG